MTGLLSREREFLKINEELDKLTNTAATLEEQHVTQLVHAKQHTAGKAQVSPKGDAQRFHTFTKGKGPSTLLKKRGAGDWATNAATMETPSNGVGTSASLKPRGRNNNNALSPRPNTLPASSNARQGSAKSAIGRNYGDTSSLASTDTNRQGRSVVSPEISARTNSRFSNRWSTGSPTTFTVKYRNPKFVESPSLEVLLKDESADVSSVLTMVANDVPNSASTISKRSQPATLGSMPKKPLSSEGLMRFLKSKVAILEQDNDRLTVEMTQQRELLNRTLERQNKVEQQRDQAFLKNNALTEQLAKIESQMADTNKDIKDRMAERTAQQKELETMKREMKLLTQANTNLEKRLYRANEELETMKSTVARVRNSEREIKETMRTEFACKEKHIKNLKKQRSELLNAYKKQVFIIDNLKRQNVCLEQSKMIGFCEKEFTKVLEWNMET